MKGRKNDSVREIDRDATVERVTKLKKKQRSDGKWKKRLYPCAAVTEHCHRRRQSKSSKRGNLVTLPWLGRMNHIRYRSTIFIPMAKFIFILPKKARSCFG